MYKIAAIGDKDSICGFASLGLTIFPVEDAHDGIVILRKIIDSGFAVIYITENLASQIESELERYRELSLPSIVLIPGVKGNTGMGMKLVSKSVEQAVGSDILGDS